MVWLIVALCSFRFRAALKANSDSVLHGADAYRTYLWPVPPGWLLIGSILLLICCLYSSLSGGVSPTAYSFFKYNLGLILILGVYVGYKLIYRTKIRNLHDIDLTTGRRVMTEEQAKEVARYQAMPRSKRFATYIQLW